MLLTIAKYNQNFQIFDKKHSKLQTTLCNNPYVIKDFQKNKYMKKTA